MITEIDLLINHQRLVKSFYELNLLDSFKEKKQISVQHRGTTGDLQLTESCGSVLLDWEKYNPAIHKKVPLREEILNETHFNITCDYFKNSYIEEVIDILREKYKVYRGRFMKMSPRTCLSIHKDLSYRIHIPIITNKDCFMLIDEKVCKFPLGGTYLVNTLLPHTAINASRYDRYHLVFCTDTCA